jgi:O-acetyl-ADP-ribose deacetylase (regulator of RNase III)
MIRFTQGNLFSANTEAVVNTVNTMGVVGKGIALHFKEMFPENFRAYVHACGTGDLKIGKVFVTENPTGHGPKYLINFPTKDHWRSPSMMEYVEKGLEDLKRVIKERGIHSIAVPPLGYGVGGLEWEEVRTRIRTALDGLEDVDVVVYEPAGRLV